MSVLRRSLISASVILLMLIPGAVEAATTDPINVIPTINIRLSDTTITPGEMLWVNVSCTYRNNTTVKVIISEIETGKVVFTSVGNVSLAGTYRTVYTPRRPIGFGDYTVWASAGNSSYFANFGIAPSLQDLYDDLRNIAENDAATHQQMEFIWRVLLPYSFFIVSFVILVCYWFWRVPGGTKEELGQWAMSNLRAHRLRSLLTDIRGLDRRGYASRHNKTPIKTDLEIHALRKHMNQLERFRTSLGKRRLQMQDRILDLNDFIQDIKNLEGELDKRIQGKEGDFEESLKIVEGKAFARNQQNRQSNDISRITPERMKRLGALNKALRGGGPPKSGGGS